jgi:N-acetylmuramoyl-L-alanine amidase
MIDDRRLMIAEVSFSVLKRCAALGCLAALALTAAGAQEPAARLSALAAEPDWTKLDQFQGTMGRDEFTRLLDTVYAPGGAWKNTIDMETDGAHVLTTGTNRWLLRFAGEGKTADPPRYWKPLAGMPRAALPLAGVTIALDPGHLGGEWARMEERWFQVGAGTLPVAEGDMTLLTSRLLAAKLEARGAKVVFARNGTEPATKLRPEDLRDAARAQLKRQGMAFIRDKYDGAADELRMNSVQWTSELLFYRTAEIQERARLVNETLKPDLVLCLHYNAEAWGDPANPQLVAKNHLHVMVNGCYSAAELGLDDVRYTMLVKLLSRCYAEELPVAGHVADSMAAATGLPPYEYTTPNAIRVGKNPYVWARNLLANRLYECPVIYIEPYVMNSKEVWDRVQAGNYAGRKLIDGKVRESIYEEYSTAVAEGVVAAAGDLRN